MTLDDEIKASQTRLNAIRREQIGIELQRMAARERLDKKYNSRLRMLNEEEQLVIARMRDLEREKRTA